jgi:hypothetical protein
MEGFVVPKFRTWADTGLSQNANNIGHSQEEAVRRSLQGQTPDPILRHLPEVVCKDQATRVGGDLPNALLPMPYLPWFCPLVRHGRATLSPGQGHDFPLGVADTSMVLTSRLQLKRLRKTKPKCARPLGARPAHAPLQDPVSELPRKAPPPLEATPPGQTTPSPPPPLEPASATPAPLAAPRVCHLVEVLPCASGGRWHVAGWAPCGWQWGCWTARRRVRDVSAPARARRGRGGPGRAPAEAGRRPHTTLAQWAAGGAVQCPQYEQAGVSVGGVTSWARQV